ncbi:MAG: hypothetical protein VXX63_00380, partial [Bacteroidota bacterium]|nr:hypothetical protein [Bacteroidota bacterium]
MKYIRSIFYGLSFCFLTHANAQISTSSANGNSTTTKISSLNEGKQNLGEVDLFTGAFQSHYTLGTVRTPSGLSFTLNLNNSSTVNLGHSQPYVGGIPYGEGWNLDVPYISISTAKLLRFTEDELSAYHCSPAKSSSCRIPQKVKKSFGSSEAVKHQDQLRWFNPYLHIPGIASGRLVFKYIKYEYNDRKVLFVLHEFASSSYVEVELCGLIWRATLPDGTVYTFREKQFESIEASHQRMLPNRYGSSESKQVIKTTEPKVLINKWYVTEIKNNNHNSNEKIRFDYAHYGKFNMFPSRTFLRLKGDLGQYRQGVVNMDYAEIYKDILLRRVYAENTSLYKARNDILDSEYAETDGNQKLDKNNMQRIITDLIELNYGEDETLRKEGMLHDGLLGKGGKVHKMDEMYNYKEIYAVGGRQGGFDGWKRYRSIRAWEMEEKLSFGDISMTNPFLSLKGGTPSYKRIKIDNKFSSPAFDHGFLESNPIEIHGRDGGDPVELPAGDIYELSTTIKNNTMYDYCNFDINILGFYGKEIAPSSRKYESYSLRDYQRRRRTGIYNTFNQAVKFNKYTSPINNNFVVRFSMPTIPQGISGIVLQVGPANSDNDFGLKTIDYIHQPNYKNNTFRSYFNAPEYIGQKGNFTNVYHKKPALRIPQNFGMGLPWMLMAYRYLEYEKEMGGKEILRTFNTWPHDQNSASNCFEFYDGPNLIKQIKQSTLAGPNTFLSAVHLRRYSKKPFVLKTVNHYTLHAEVDEQSENKGTKLHKTNSLLFSYDLKKAAVYANAI